ncbi:MAG: TIGR02302 family protein [Xanthobacteraceae bacterium]|nr:TIGR02302 family protein [Xanthobacteraceae bacterium]
MTDTPSSHPATSQPGAAPVGRSPLDTAVRRARWTIFWERLWPALAQFATVIGLFLTVSWLGVWLYVPPLARAGGLIVFAILAIAAIVPFVFLRVPAVADALRRLDHGARHRPATTIADQLAVTPQDPYSLALWKAHVARTLATARAFQAGWPSPRVALRDPYALRSLILVAGIATFIAAGGEHWKRIAAAFDWQGVVLPANFRVDAWINPPVYTGKPPIILAGIHPGEPVRTDSEAGEPVSVPAGSTLVIRATGKLNLDISGRGGVTPAREEVRAPAGTQEYRFKIAATGTATLRGAGDDLTWAFNAIPDKSPTIALTKDPEQQARGSLLLSYRLEDDYGVTEAQATFARKDEPGGDKPDARPLFGPPDFPLVLPQARAKSGVGQTIKDLTDHPWAGAEVTMILVARDEGGNEGKSEPFAFRLPERVFTKPLARALVEQRRNLALDAGARPQVTTALDALALAPEKFTPDAGVYLGLRSLFWSLVRAKTDDDLREVTARLWQMAVGIEDGNIADAQAALRNAEEALRQALERGASDQEIKQLMDQLRAAMDRYMQSMQEQLKNKQQLARPLDRNSRVLRQQDLKNMLDRLENLARNGAKDAARQLLQQLEQMMENLQMASPDQNGDDLDDMMSQLDELGDMIHEQQNLRDRTFRQGQNNGQNKGQAQRRRNGQQGQQGDQQSDESMDQLRQNQQALRDRLNKLLEELKKRGLGQNQKGEQGQGQNGMDQLGQAGEAMGEAEGQLGDGNADSAVDSQGRALDALRKGAQGLAQSMQQQMGQGPGPGQNGRLGLPRAQRDTDPLGRPLRGRDYGDDVTVKVPGEIDVQRARRIIEELRRRFGDILRPQEELDYIERLLKDY